MKMETEIKKLTDDQKLKLAAKVLSMVEPTQENLTVFLNAVNESVFGELQGWFEEKK